jgi:hypothetical protein
LQSSPIEQRQNLERFGEAVLADRRLHEQLRSKRDAGAFAALAVQLGEERGFVFTAEVVESALRERRRAWLEKWIQ